ncbi:hypothetical protein JCM11491_001471 [Sporobolomyces phaffii]
MPRGSTSQGGARRRSRSPARNSGDDDNERGRGGLDQLELADPLKTCRHLYLQTLISRRVVSSELAERLYKDCVKLCKVEDAPAMEDFVASIETGLNLIGFELKQTKDQETGQNAYILSNSVQDASAKLATDYKAEEIGFFKAIVEKIMHARELSYCVTQTEAVKAAKAPITRVLGIQLIKSFLARDWLALHPASGRLILSARSLLELAPYLRETFGDEDEDEVEPRDRVIVYCNYCTKIVTSGYACANRHCGIRLHTFCANAQIDASGKCPDHLSATEDPCSRVWKKDPATDRFNALPVGPAALGGDADPDPTSHAGDDDDDEGAHGASAARKKQKKQQGKAAKGKAPAKPRGKGKKKQASDDEDEEMDDDDDEEEEEEEGADEDEDEEEDGAGTPTQSSTRRSSRRSTASAGRRQVIQPDSDEEEDE